MYVFTLCMCKIYNISNTLKYIVHIITCGVINYNIILITIILYAAFNIWWKTVYLLNYSFKTVFMYDILVSKW